MTRTGLRALSAMAAVAALAAGHSACSPRPIGEKELVASLESFDLAVRDQPRESLKVLLREQAARFKGRLITVSFATVASPYLREDTSNIYFGVTYDARDHVFLSELDPDLHEALKNHRLWVSIVKSYPSRQLSYELPVDHSVFEALRPGQHVGFSCRIAALIRGKSVYCCPDGIRVMIAE